MTYYTIPRLFFGCLIFVLSISIVRAQDSTQSERLRSHDVNEQTLKNVAKAYEAIEEIRARHRNKYGDLAEADLSKEVERQLIEEFMAAVEAEGITWNTYSRVLKSINQDVVLRDRFVGYVGEEIVVKSTRSDERDITRGVANGNVHKIAAQDMESMPLSGPEEVIGLLPGIESGLRIRGGSPSEVEFRVDGRSMRDGRTQAPFMGVSYTQIEEIHVETGGFNAEYGNARSGVISIKTKGGIDEPQLVRVSDAQLEDIARAYVAVEQIRREYNLSDAQLSSEDKSVEQRQAEYDMGQAITSRGVDIDTYMEVIEAIDTNSALRANLARKVEQVQEGSILP